MTDASEAYGDMINLLSATWVHPAFTEPGKRLMDLPPNRPSKVPPQLHCSCAGPSIPPQALAVKEGGFDHQES